MYDVPSTTTFMKALNRACVVKVFTIRAKMMMTFTYRSENTSTAPPGQTEKGAVASITRPRPSTAMSSGVSLVTGAPRDRRAAASASTANVPVRSPRWSGLRKGSESCGRMNRTKVNARSPLYARTSCRD